MKCKNCGSEMVHTSESSTPYQIGGVIVGGLILLSGFTLFPVLAPLGIAIGIFHSKRGYSSHCPNCH